MKLLKYALIILIALPILGIGGLAFLGMQSRGGTAPGLVDGQLSPCPSSPNCVSSEVETESEKRVDPLPITAWAGLPGLIAELGGTVTVQDERYLAAEFTSGTFGFVDDVEFRLTDTEVQIRSASRVGHSDAGVNAARVADIQAKIGT